MAPNRNRAKDRKCREAEIANGLRKMMLECKRHHNTKQCQSMPALMMLTMMLVYCELYLHHGQGNKIQSDVVSDIYMSRFVRKKSA